MDSINAIEVIVRQYFETGPHDWVWTPKVNNKPDEYQARRNTHVRASSLGFCPLKPARAIQLQNVSAVAEGPMSVSTAWRMFQGVALGAALQNIMLVTAPEHEWNVDVERYLYSNTLRLQGTADIVLWDDESVLLIECKHRYPKVEPRESDLYQMYAYVQMLAEIFPQQEISAVLAILSTPTYSEQARDFAGMDFYEMKWTDEIIALRGPNGRYNMTLETAVWRQALQTHLEYLDGLRTDPPIKDVIKDDDAWQCRRILRYPKGGKPGLLQATCPVWCHKGIALDEDFTAEY